MEAFLEEEGGLRSRQNLNKCYRDGSEGIPGKGSRRSKGPETAVRGMVRQSSKSFCLGRVKGAK